MAVEHNMAELNTTWWDLLRRIVFNLDWSYAALWTLTADGRNLIWKQGYFHNRSNDDANAVLFHSLYSSCTFTPGVGFAGHALAHMTNSILWLSGHNLDCLERPVENQTRFLTAAGIQTVVCLPLGLPSSSYVLELGTVARVQESEDSAHDIKRVLLHLLAAGLPHLINENTGPGTITQPAAHQAASDLFRGKMRAAYDNPHPQPSVAMANETPLEAQQQHRQPGSNIFSELLQSMENDDIFARHVAQGILNAVPLQLSVEFPELPGPSHGDRLTSWATESSLSQMEMNAFQSWTSMAEATTSLDVALRGLPGSSSATSSRLAEEIVDPNDEVRQILPFVSTLEQLIAAASADQHEQQQQHGLLGAVAAGASLKGSSSMSSMSLRSQNVEDTEISSAILESYADCHISEMENVPGGGSSSTTMAGESEGNWRGGELRGSAPSSKETSPDSNVPYPRQSYGIHPRISSTGSSARKDLQGIIDIQQHGGTSAEPSQPQRSRRVERQHLSLAEQNRQELEDLKPNATPRLVQFGNVLQLGNAAGQVTEPLPQEYDEAAVSHMLAERRRRTKQNENFNQLKFLIPSAGKMDKASLLAATITYINELKGRVEDLEKSNHSLKNQLSGGEQEISSSAVEPLMTTRAKGSPGRVRVRTPNSLSPTDEDKIQVSPNGDGNLTIEIRSPCTPSDTAMHIFACLKDMQLKVINFNVAVNENRIYASIIVKVKRKNSAGQSAVCAEVEQALTACLSNLG